ncbi:MAG: N-acyl-D-aspartate/D-glutamate deacylase [Glaciecola sp.]|jgi:N-acyl-D-aspartate/D-glutamate deacylase
MLISSLSLLTGCIGNEAPEIDILIANGTVYTGDNSAPQALDVAVCGTTICGLYLSNEPQVDAKNIIDVSGKIVSPGFIDPHTHSLEDLYSKYKNHNLNYLMQGVTTVVNGNDGGGPVNIGKTANDLQANGIGTNVALLVGHGSLRKQVMGTAQRYASAAEIADMKNLLINAMEQGALGLSSGLYYVPGSFAATEEIVELAKVAAKYNGIYDTHLRDESTFNIGFLAALQEAIDIARSAKIHLHVAHIKALGVDVWGQSEQAIKKINQAKSEGVSISADQYPWQASGTNLRSAVVPKWAMADSEHAFLGRLDDVDLIVKIKNEISENIRRRGGPESLLVTASENPQLMGKTLADIANELELSAVQSVIQLVKQGRTRIASFNMHKDDIENFMQQPWVVTSSDGTNGHPRKYASFPQKYQQYVLGSQTVDLVRFIHSSSGQTAQILGLGDRGFIQMGFKADILVFDPTQYEARANFKAWNRLSTGVNYLLINGQVVIENSQYTGKLAGQFVARNRD